MKYKEYRITTTENEIAKLVDGLNALGCTDLIIEDTRDGALQCAVSFYRGEDETLSDELLSYLQTEKLCLHICDDEDWLHKYEEYLKPVKAGKRIVICPSWEEYAAQTGETVIYIDPNLAFGSGANPTTCLVIQLMEEFFKKNCTAIDVGCGTGVLAIAAAKLGASHIDAIDLDEQAVHSSGENARLNFCSDKINVFKGDLLREFDIKADFIFANLPWDVLPNLIPGLTCHCNEGGMVLASGFMDFRQEEAIKAFEENGFEIVKVVSCGEWVGLAASLR